MVSMTGRICFIGHNKKSLKGVAIVADCQFDLVIQMFLLNLSF